MFKGMFKSKEVKDLLRALARVQPHSSNPAFLLIKPDIYKLVIQMNKKTIGSIRDKHQVSHETFIFVLMMNVLKVHLCSGSYHVYRGVLSMQGQTLLELLDYVVEQLLESGFCDLEAANKNKEWVRSEINKVG